VQYYLLLVTRFRKTLRKVPGGSIGPRRALICCQRCQFRSVFVCLPLTLHCHPIAIIIIAGAGVLC
jgi:hypothetical protein